MKEMSLVDHLTELRVRVIRICFILFIAFFVCYHFGDKIIDFLLLPLKNSFSENGKIVYIGILDKVLTQFQLSFWSSVIISSPFWFYQLWLFIRPALYDKEVKVIRPFLLVGFFLFWCGICFGYFIVFPLVYPTLMNFGVAGIEANINLKDYIILTLKVLVLLGMLFQLPNIMIILGFMDMVTKQSLRALRGHVYVGFAVLSAMITPPDPMTMMMLWLPLVALYEFGILAVAFIVHPYLKRKYA